ncbi:hypothetical protein RA269_28595, partial [Pseudomonas syringae pv. tagetis]
LKAAQQRYRNNLQPAVYHPLVNNSNQSFAPQDMDQRPSKRLREGLKDTSQSLQFIQSPLGSKIVNAELTATRADQLGKHAQG